MGSPGRVVLWGRRPAGRAVVLALALGACLAPAWLFSDFLTTSRLSGDDVAYIAGSRTLPRALESLFVPHNTHVVPSLRLLTWALVAGTGRLSGLQQVLPAAAYLSLVGAVVLTGAVVARETGRAVAGLAAMVAAGTTSTMWSAGVYYAASQATWAGIGILAVLWFLQGWRRDGRRWRLAASALAAWVAGGFWSLGHAAGPVGAVYLWSAGGRGSPSRRAAGVPLAATAVAVAINLGLGGRQINESARRNDNFHGQTLGQALSPARGLLCTLRVVPVNLIFGNLGAEAEVTTGQGVTLTLGLIAAWLWWRVVPGRATPLEYAGATMVLLCYLTEWTVRGYLPFWFVRKVYAWYDILPHLGAVLFACGWWWGAAADPGAPVAPASRAQALAILLLLAGLLALHVPRVESIFEARQPPLSPSEAEQFPLASQRRARALYLASDNARRQQLQLRRFERAEAVARSRGIGRDAINGVFEPVLSPSTPRVGDGDLFDLPRGGTETDPDRIRAAVGNLMGPVPEQPPPWLNDRDPRTPG
jgi:hypothetical protein